MPLRKHAEEMRDMYAEEIAAALAAGATPSPLQIASWEKYAAAAQSSDPAAVMSAPVVGILGAVQGP